jgi:hypothetical protein
VGNPDRYRSRSANEQRRGLSLPLLGGCAGSRLFLGKYFGIDPGSLLSGWLVSAGIVGTPFALLIQRSGFTPDQCDRCGSLTPLVECGITGLPLISSKRLKCAVTAGWDKCSCLAAVEILPSFATTTKDRSKRRSRSFGFIRMRVSLQIGSRRANEPALSRCDLLTFDYHQGRSGQYLEKMKNPLLETLLE